jgi:hypothetical protein
MPYRAYPIVRRHIVVLLRPLGFVVLALAVMPASVAFASALDQDIVPLALLGGLLFASGVLALAIYQFMAWNVFTMTFGPGVIFINELHGLTKIKHSYNVEGNTLTCEQHIAEKPLDIGTLRISTNAESVTYTRLHHYSQLYAVVGDGYTERYA